MKIYFAGSIRGGRDNVEVYSQLIEHLRKYGEVLTEHVGDRNLSLNGEDGLEDIYIHNRDMEWLGQSNVVVADVTTTSTGVGYEIGRIVERNKWVFSEISRKPILCLYRAGDNGRLSAMVNGSDGVRNAKYKDVEEAKKAIDDFFSEIKR